MGKAMMLVSGRKQVMEMLEGQASPGSAKQWLNALKPREKSPGKMGLLSIGAAWHKSSLQEENTKP